MYSVITDIGIISDTLDTHIEDYEEAEEKARTYFAQGRTVEIRDEETSEEVKVFKSLGAIRRECGLTQQQLSTASGIPLTTIQKLESGANRLAKARVDTVLALARALDLTVEELVNT